MYTTTELFEACSILFGPEISVSIDFLKYLRPSGIKDAYWRRALETHPDRARVMGEDEARMNERFKKINEAYECLISAIKEDGTVLMEEERLFRSAPAPRSRPREARNDHFYKGRVPDRMLPIGQFLYYSGLISWNALIESLMRQKKQRPLIGQIAQKWGLLTPEDIRQILRKRHYQERFGDCALRIGYITSFNLISLVGKQRRLQRPLGEYLTQYGLTRKTMDEMVEKQRRHNRRFLSPRRERP